MSTRVTKRFPIGPPKELWFLFDTGNKVTVSTPYMLWFETLEEARDYRMDQMAIPNCGVPSKPVKYLLADAIEDWP